MGKPSIRITLLGNDEASTEDIALEEHDAAVTFKSRSRTDPASWRLNGFWRKLLLICFFVAVQFYLFRFFYPARSGIGILRPALHFTPSEAWLNDPNGLFIDANGTWHMYYQYLEDTYEAGDCKNWGHATSTDLYTWTTHPIALYCDKYGMWSGSIVVDTNNTSGLFPQGQTDGVVAIYTQHHLESGVEEQAIAYSSDGGFTFKKFSKNPVLRSGSPSYNFRDPKVIWHEATRRWVLAVAQAASQAVEFYTSHDLINWRAASEFRNPHLDNSGASFECPNLVPIPYFPWRPTPLEAELDLRNGESGHWVLLVSSGSGSPLNGGSVTRYFPGIFNGTHFEPIDDRADRVIDFGPDNYASQFFYGLQNGRPLVSLGWASNLAYCGNVPTGPREGWRGALTAPRTAVLSETEDGDVQFKSPPIGLDDLRGKTLLHKSIRQKTEFALAFGKKNQRASALLLEIWFELLGPQQSQQLGKPTIIFAFVSSISKEEVSCAISFGAHYPSFSCDRSNAGIDWQFPGSMSTMSTPKFPGLNKDAWRKGHVQAVIDRSMLEVYLNGGLQSGTMTFYPNEELDTVVFRASAVEDRVEVEVKVQELDMK